MKKILFSTLALFALSVTAMAQEAKMEVSQKNFIGLTAGPAFAVGDFGSNDLNNNNAGLAKTGLLIDLKYGHHFSKIWGLAADAVYGRHNIDKSVINESNLSVDPWQYYGIMVGPMATATIAPKNYLDFSLLSGALFARFPESSANGQNLTQRDWSTVLPIKAAADFRLGFSNSGYIFAGASYMYAKPQFNVSTSLEGFNITGYKQKMEVLGIYAGIGLGF